MNKVSLVLHIVNYLENKKFSSMEELGKFLFIYYDFKYITKSYQRNMSLIPIKEHFSFPLESLVIFGKVTAVNGGGYRLAIVN